MSPKSKKILGRFLSAADDYALKGTHSGTPRYSEVIQEYFEALTDLKGQLR